MSLLLNKKCNKVCKNNKSYVIKTCPFLFTFTGTKFQLQFVSPRKLIFLRFLARKSRFLGIKRQENKKTLHYTGGCLCSHTLQTQSTVNNMKSFYNRLKPQTVLIHENKGTDYNSPLYKIISHHFPALYS